MGRISWRSRDGDAHLSNEKTDFDTNYLITDYNCLMNISALGLPIILFCHSINLVYKLLPYKCWTGRQTGYD